MIKVILSRVINNKSNNNEENQELFFLSTINKKNYLLNNDFFYNVDTWSIGNVKLLIKELNNLENDFEGKKIITYKSWNKNLNLFIEFKNTEINLELELSSNLNKLLKVIFTDKDINNSVELFKKLSKEEQFNAMVYLFKKVKYNEDLLLKLNLSLNSKILSYDQYFKYFLINHIFI